MPPTKSSATACNIQVALRCRPRNQAEIESNSPNAVECNSSGSFIDVKVKTGARTETKTYSFDRVFDGASTQIEVYQSVVEPILDEVLQGYNCTVFAYGQTGTGKTHTMEGSRSSEQYASYADDPNAGIIPRTLHQMFEKLDASGNEYSVRVSFLEIYNEELFDLLSGTDDTKKLRLYEDSKSKGSVVIQGLEEVIVSNREKVYEIMQKGAEKRRTSETNMNKQSSRSHSIFITTIHQKENNMNGEEVIKTGKLYLVDLAGSENIGRSGAVKDRAREAGNINQSLLTLGRVINKLVERSMHIPYRESKLTRILQDSLGGKTKTSIIATISPALINLEETLSTLDYAIRAKDIENKPEVNQKLTKKALIKEYTEEIEKLKRDLIASRDKNGIYISSENYEEMTGQLEGQKATIESLTEKIKAAEENLLKVTELFDTTKEELETVSTELHTTKNVLEKTETTLHKTKTVLKETKKDRDIHKMIVGEHAKNEDALHGQANKLLSTVDESVGHVDGLHKKIMRKMTVEQHNQSVINQLNKDFSDHVANTEEKLVSFCQKQQQTLSSLSQAMSAFSDSKSSEMNTLVSTIASLKMLHSEQMLKQSNVINAQSSATTAYTQQSVQAMQGAAADNAAMLQNMKDTIATTLLVNLEAQLAQQTAKMDALLSVFASSITMSKENLNTFSNEMEGQIKSMSAQVCDSLSTLNADMEANLNSIKSKFKEQEGKRNTAAQALSEHILSSISQFFAKDETFVKETEADVEQKMHATIQSIKDTNTAISQNASLTAAQCNTLAQQQAKEWDTMLEKAQMEGESVKAVMTENKETNDNVANLLSANISEMQEKLNLEMQTAQTLSQQFMSESEIKMSMYHSEVQQSMESMETQTTDLSYSVAATQQDIVRVCSEWNTSTSEINSISSSISENIEKDNVQVKKMVNEYLTQQYKTDVPTGATPQKKTYEYPRALVRTRPYEELTKEFTMQLEAEPSESANGSFLAADMDENENPVETKETKEEEEEEDDDDEISFNPQANKENSGSAVNITASKIPAMPKRPLETIN